MVVLRLETVPDAPERAPEIMTIFCYPENAMTVLLDFLWLTLIYHKNKHTPYDKIKIEKAIL